jgi:hypothetical protein
MVVVAIKKSALVMLMFDRDQRERLEMGWKVPPARRLVADMTSGTAAE